MQNRYICVMRDAASQLFKKHGALIFVFVLSAMVYGRFLFFGHTHWDDPEMVFRNKDVKDFNITAFFTNHYTGNYIPLTMFAHSIAWQLSGSADWGHHLINILLHLLNGWLVYKAGKKIFAHDAVATAGTLLFLLHPMQVESVGWIAELKNMLSSTFYLLSFLQYLNWKQNGRQKSYLMSLLAFVAACLSKSSVVVLPLVLIASDILMHREKFSGLWLNKIPFILLAILFGVINLRTQAADLYINVSHEFPYYERLGFAGFALLKYFQLFFAPFNLSVIYPYPETKTLPLTIGLIFVAFLFLSLLYTVRKKKHTLLFILAFVVCHLLLVLQFIPFGEALYADRYAYLPLIGFGWAIGLAFKRLSLKNGIVTGLGLLLAAATFLRGEVWRSGISLYSDILKKYPDSFVALNSLGAEYMFDNQDKNSMECYTRAIRVAPSNPKAYYNRGLLYIKTNEPARAIADFDKSIKLGNYSKAFTGRATAYFMAGDISKALSDATHVLNAEPENAKAHYVAGNCYNELNQLDAALREYNICIALNLEEAEYYFKRAIVMGKKQDFKSCLGDLDICLMLNPSLFEAYYWRGVVKVNLHQNPCSDFKTAAQKNYEPAAKAYYRYCN